MADEPMIENLSPRLKRRLTKAMREEGHPSGTYHADILHGLACASYQDKECDCQPEFRVKPDSLLTLPSGLLHLVDPVDVRLSRRVRRRPIKLTKKTEDTVSTTSAETRKPHSAKSKWIATCLPIIGNTNPGYLKNKPTAWLNGFGVVEYFGSRGFFNLFTVVVSGGQCSYGGKVYGGRKGARHG